MGEGKYSEVFQGVDSGNNNSLVVIKNIRPGKERKVQNMPTLPHVTLPNPFAFALETTTTEPMQCSPWQVFRS